ncbi:MAG: response regulator [Rubrivivax sp.]|nr:response regulator [Rubrivivax sp.]
MIDRDIHLARALLIESNPLLRSVAAAQLRDTGVGHVTQSSRVKDARLLLEHERFDIVLCNREFEGSDYSGQDLLDELRREKLLPHSTVFLMVTAQASYIQVMEAAESALDGFLVRPYTTAALGARLLEARNRKRELGDVLRALDAGENDAALVRAVKRYQEQAPYWTYCGRLAAELLMTMERPADARKLFENLAKLKPDATWAQLGAARAMSALGDSAGARKAVAAALERDAGSADAHDLMGRLLVEQCDFDGALAEYRAAAELTPGCLLRAQHAGALAFYQGQADEALKWLERTLGMGVQSKLFDALTLLLLAVLRFDRGDAAGVAALREQLRRYRERRPESGGRLLRLEQIADTLGGLMGPQPESALPALRELAAQVALDDFDLEAANLVLGLWARVPERVRPAADHEAVLDRAAMRFCVSKAVGEVLLASAQRAEVAVTRVRACQAKLLATTEQAMEQSMKGEPAAAVSLLLAEGEKTLNAKLLEMAALLARRHAAAIPDAEALAERAAALLRRSARSGGHIAGIQRSGRSPGGLQLRGAAPAEAAPAATAAVPAVTPTSAPSTPTAIDSVAAPVGTPATAPAPAPA